MTPTTTRQRLLIPGLAGLYESLQELVYPLIRVTSGVFLTMHGGQKLFGWFAGDIDRVAGGFAKFGLEPALPLAYLVGIVEFFGGLCIALGLFTRFWAAGCVILLAVAVFRVHLENGFFWTQGGFEYPLMWMLISIAILIRGGGRYSLDRRLPKEL
ncbi:MAG TPA: DoxX family protein [Burkholderiales bacterium]|nr:DoxX family protein [Burkholderiales bacterium]